MHTHSLSNIAPPSISYETVNAISLKVDFIKKLKKKFKLKIDGECKKKKKVNKGMFKKLRTILKRTLNLTAKKKGHNYEIVFT